MFGKTVFYITAALCVFAFAPSVSQADGHCAYSKQGKEKGFWQRFSRDENHKDKHGYEHKRGCGHKHGSKCGHKRKSGAGALWWRSSSMAERLRLDEGQVARLDEIAASYHERIVEAYDTAREAKWEFRKIMKDPEASAESIRAAAEKKHDSMIEKKRIKLDMRLEMRKVMTYEQIRYLALLKNKGHKGCGSGGK